MAQTTETHPPSESVADQLTFWLHNLVDLLRANTIRPLEILVRSLIVVAFVSVASLLLLGALFIGLFRLIDAEVFTHQVWATYALFAGLFLIIGAIALKLARPISK